MTVGELRSAASDVVVLEERRTASGHTLGLATLNVEKTLNSLSLPMIEVLAPALAAWNERRDVVAILLRGAGERAFCAGGDIQALYRCMTRNRAAGAQVDDYAGRFFEAEYRLDYAIRRSRKPVLCFGHGVVMGGGLGLFSASKYRLVTERSRIAMPEVTIGLFPDAGASWILRGLSCANAVWLGMTGTHMSTADAMFIGLGTHAIPASGWSTLVDGLANASWAASEADARVIEACIAACGQAKVEQGALEQHQAALDAALPALPATPQETAARLMGLGGLDAWLDKGLAAMAAGCPTSIGIVHEQIRRVPTMSLEDVFRMELSVANACAVRPDFVEGIRALIIDKDNKPAWRYRSVQELPHQYVGEHFDSPSAMSLADLGER